MAGDWIKMRVWLRRDPRIAKMANFITSNVTRNVTLDREVAKALVVACLLEVWGVARERGQRSGDDLVLHHCHINDLDEICGVQRIGAALRFVGWASERTEKIDGSITYDCVVFPRFFADNESPDDRYRRQNAERQARFRNSRVTADSNVTVTPREEKRREEVISTSLRSVERRAPVESIERAKRATRLPADWQLPDEWRDWAAKVHGVDPQAAVRISLVFRDHFLAAPGVKGRKDDWLATWRNWVRREVGDAGLPQMQRAR